MRAKRNFRRVLQKPHPRGVVRLVLEMNCTTCGRLAQLVHPYSIPDVALRHAANTGHVVILNGTADLLTDNERIEGHCLQFIEATVRDGDNSTEQDG